MSQQSKIKDSFREYYIELLGQEEAQKFFDSFEKINPPRTVRVNTLKTTKEELTKWLESNGYTVNDSKYSSDGLEIRGEGRPLSLKLPYMAGFTYPQDHSSMLAVEILNPQPGETIIDLTAAPGGKTTHIAQRMKNTGVLIANDMDTKRLKALHSNLERLGVWNVITMRMMPHKIAEVYPETFDKVLLDPSCSGEGLLAKGSKPSFWSLKALKRYSSEQFGMLKSAFSLLKPGGTLVYSTCTLNKLEDDAVVERLLEEFPQAEIADVSSEFLPKQLPGFLGFRFWPQITGTKGFFCIKIRKNASQNLYPQKPPVEFLDVLNSHEVKEFEKYLEEFGTNLPDANFVKRDGNLFVVSKEVANFKLPAHYSLAFPLLKIFASDLKPSHSGAIWLGLHAKKNVIELNREQVEDIVDRQSFESDKPDGTYLVKFEKFPIGFGKVIKGQLEVNFPRQY